MTVYFCEKITATKKSFRGKKIFDKIVKLNYDFSRRKDDLGRVVIIFATTDTKMFFKKSFHGLVQVFCDKVCFDCKLTFQNDCKKILSQNSFPAMHIFILERNVKT